MFLRGVKLLANKEIERGDYPFTIPSIQNFEELYFQQSVTFFVGENGSGKSTLLEAIADKCDFHTAGGGRNNSYDVHASQSDLGKYIRLSWLPKVTNGFFLRAETFYQFATHVDGLEGGDPGIIQYYGGKSLHEQSHGESFLSLFTHRFGGKAIFLLDEPEAALSPMRQLALLKIMYDLTKDGDAQFIIATHSPILLGYPDATIFHFDDKGIQEVAYEDTEHYQITSYFLQHREKMLHDLFMEEEDEGTN